MITGILFGLTAALLQSVSYLFSATFTARFQTGALSQFLLNHLSIGLLSLLSLPLVWDVQALEVSRYIWPLLGAMGCYLVAQTALYRALKHSPASRVSPLLGIKVLVLALIGVFWLQHSYQGLQWLGVGLCLLGAYWLSYSGGIIHRVALLWVVLACVGYAVSDLFVLELIERFEGLPRLQAAGLSVALCYLLAGLVSLLWWPGLKERHLLVYSLPAALSWFLALIALFACFAWIGVVFGGVVQSARGLFSILLGLVLAWLSWRYAEPLPAGSVFVQRFAAATLMLVAIALFSLGSGTA
ncbi:MAG: EamA family transporter [Marinobacterium sp.]|nr:EamA family transporter [Marinobacterium sp.]